MIQAPNLKSVVTNLSALVLIACGWYWQNQHVLLVGSYAFSGAITNWLAIYMLFDKVPLLYGSGVIPSRFEEFKASIKHLIMSEFFSQENISRFFKNSTDLELQQLDLKPLMEKLDYDKLFQGLVDTIVESPFGGMLNMVGGAAALEPLKMPFTEKTQQLLIEISQSETFIEAVMGQSHFHPELVLEKVTHIIDQRLAELTPTMVKEIVQNMIRRHLGWLVVWGGVFGGIIGFAMSWR